MVARACRSSSFPFTFMFVRQRLPSGVKSRS
ncbi:hypothetical protein SRU_0778 [Salinibacter ruber DSM 13855]|uniref:Uncharacterized protein n=1 Tax=Salinibacter ruber (strain DSM 13855 / M31) TaxID=309807 RepID=Q2S4G5_SALRD|nr:hypothetical protein SRU_0778 [Salinibacter ruber DSM 13855]